MELLHIHPGYSTMGTGVVGWFAALATHLQVLHDMLREAITFTLDRGFPHHVTSANTLNQNIREGPYPCGECHYAAQTCPLLLFSFT